MIHSDTLMNYLRSVRENTGTMASLRCLLRPNQRMRGWLALSPLNAIGDRTVEVVAGLYATHPLESTDPEYGFGAACQRLAKERTKKVGKKDDDGGTDKAVESSPMDARFQRLLTCSREELLTHLPELILGMKSADSAGIPVNYGDLYLDVCFWSERTRVKWAKQYWKNPAQKGEEDHVSD